MSQRSTAQHCHIYTPFCTKRKSHVTWNFAVPVPHSEEIRRCILLFLCTLGNSIDSFVSSHSLIAQILLRVSLHHLQANYSHLRVEFLTDPSDSCGAYEARGRELSTCMSSMDKGMQAIQGQFSHTQQVEMFTGKNLASLLAKLQDRGSLSTVNPEYFVCMLFSYISCAMASVRK